MELEPKPLLSLPDISSGSALVFTKTPSGLVGVHIEVYMIGVNHAIFSQIGTNGAVRVIQIVLESRKIVFDHAGSNGLADLDDGIIGVNAFFRGGLVLSMFGHAQPHHVVHMPGHISVSELMVMG